jgi:hypothetical protein
MLSKSGNGFWRFPSERIEVRSDTCSGLTLPELRSNILEFYSDLSVPIDTKKDQVRWQVVLTELDQLKAVTPVPTLAGSPVQ